MKKLLKVVAAIVVATILLLVAVPYLFKDKIEEIIKQEGNKMLDAEFDFGKLGSGEIIEKILIIICSPDLAPL